MLAKSQMTLKSFQAPWCSWLLLLIIMTDVTNGGLQGPIEGYNSLDDFTTTTMVIPTPSYVHPKWMEPYFDPSTPRNVTALMGKSAYLSCRVRNLGNKTVSWIRHRDIHILTVGSYTYTSDQRFQATYHQDNDDWTLQIKWAQKRDAGMYECQISTQPVRSYFVRLNVVVPTATILGGPDLHVDKGSTINLTCTVKFSPEPPAYIFWYHHEEVINYDSSRGGVSVITEKGDVTTSFLLIQNADLADSGKYSCAPTNEDLASVRVHVLNGEHPEAMQTGTTGSQFSWFTMILFVGLVFSFNQRQCSTLKRTLTFATRKANKTRIISKMHASSDKSHYPNEGTIVHTQEDILTNLLEAEGEKEEGAEEVENEDSLNENSYKGPLNIKVRTVKVLGEDCKVLATTAAMATSIQNRPMLLFCPLNTGPATEAFIESAIIGKLAEKLLKITETLSNLERPAFVSNQKRETIAFCTEANKQNFSQLNFFEMETGANSSSTHHQQLVLSIPSKTNNKHDSGCLEVEDEANVAKTSCHPCPALR